MQILFLFLPLFAFGDSKIDLQFSICDSSPEAVLQKLDQAKAKTKESPITYYDSPLPQYLQDGVSLRTKTKKNANISSVKIRFDREVQIPEANCEWDLYGTQEKYTCEVTASVHHPKHPWSKEQKLFLSRYYQESDLSSLQAFGPYRDRKWKLEHKGEKISFDSVDTDEAGPIMEISQKVPYSQKEETYAKFQHWLRKHGVVLCDRQEPKTARLFRALWILR